MLAPLCLIVALSEWLRCRTPLRIVGAALIVIVITAVAAALGALPAGATEANPVPGYEGVFTYVIPLSIFWLLLPVSLRGIFESGTPPIALFPIDSVATGAGVPIGMWAGEGSSMIGPLHHARATFLGFWAAAHLLPLLGDRWHNLITD